MPACFANSAECIMNFLLPIRPPGAGYIMQDARVLEGVHACVSSTTILPPTTLDEPLGEREEIYIYIYYFQFTVYILRSCSLSIPIDQAAYLVQDSI